MSDEMTLVRERTAWPALGPQLQWEIEQFLYTEAATLDAWRYEAWLAMFTPDFRYTMPIVVDRLRRHNRRYKASEDDLLVFEEDVETMTIRIKRLESPTCWSEDPPTRARRLVSNVRISPGAAAEELRVDSNFIMTLSRLDKPVETFTGLREDVLRRDPDGGWKIASRKILGDQTVLPMISTTVFF